MNSLPFTQASEWLSHRFADRWQVAFDHLIAWAETWLLVVALFLSVLLVGAGLWLYHVCIRMGVGALRPSGRLKHQAAEQRAEVLLRENVSDRHYQQLLGDGYLEVPSQLYPGRTYRLPQQPGRVTVCEGGRRVGQLCVIACDPVPHADLILTQKWLIEADEQAYLTLANWIGDQPPWRALRGLQIRRQQPL